MAGDEDLPDAPEGAPVAFETLQAHVMVDSKEDLTKYVKVAKNEGVESGSGKRSNILNLKMIYPENLPRVGFPCLENLPRVDFA